MSTLDLIRTELRSLDVASFFANHSFSISPDEIIIVENAIYALTLLRYDLYGDRDQTFLNKWINELPPIDIRLNFLFQQIFTKIVIPELAKDFNRNKLPIAYALCFIDAADLDIDTRTRMGITQTSPTSVPNPPDLFHITQMEEFGRNWIAQCPDGPRFLEWVNDQACGDIISMAHNDWNYSQSNSKIEYNYELNPRQKSFNSISKSIPIVVFDTLILKRAGTIINAFCTSTTEISSKERSIVFVEGVFYALRDQKLLEILNKNIHDISNLPFNLNLLPGADVYDDRLVNAILESTDFGGLWQPTVLLSNQGSMVETEA